MPCQAVSSKICYEVMIVRFGIYMMVAFVYVDLTENGTSSIWQT